METIFCVKGDFRAHEIQFPLHDDKQKEQFRLAQLCSDLGLLRCNYKICFKNFCARQIQHSLKTRLESNKKHDFIVDGEIVYVDKENNFLPFQAIERKL